MLKAWYVIGRERPVGISGIQGIPLSAIERYLRFWPEYDPLYFVELIIRVDDLWRESEQKRQEAKNRAG